MAQTLRTMITCHECDKQLEYMLLLVDNLRNGLHFPITTSRDFSGITNSEECCVLSKDAYSECPSYSKFRLPTCTAKFITSGIRCSGCLTLRFRLLSHRKLPYSWAFPMVTTVVSSCGCYLPTSGKMALLSWNYEYMFKLWGRNENLYLANSMHSFVWVETVR